MGAASGASADKAPPVDIGSPRKFSEEGISEEFLQHDFFVIRHRDLIFAASTICPHMGNTLQRDPQDPRRITCGTHGSVFDGEGVVVVGPASTGLVRLGVSLNKDGHIIVDRNKEFPQDKWNDKSSFVEAR